MFGTWNLLLLVVRYVARIASSKILGIGQIIVLREIHSEVSGVSVSVVLSIIYNIKEVRDSIDSND